MNTDRPLREIFLTNAAECRAAYEATPATDTIMRDHLLLQEHKHLRWVDEMDKETQAA